MTPDAVDQLRVILHPLVLDVESEAFPVITVASLREVAAR